MDWMDSDRPRRSDPSGEDSRCRIDLSIEGVQHRTFCQHEACSPAKQARDELRLVSGASQKSIQA